MYTDDMRDATKEEIKSVNDYVKSISTDTGINFFDLLDKADKPHDVKR